MRNIKLVLEYDGTDFLGWQTQASGRTVQQETCLVLEQILQESVNLIGAGRTDSGVHARGQVANFRTSSSVPAQSLLRAMNGLLPADICVRSIGEVAESFHARFDARLRVYRYTIVRHRIAIGRHYAWVVHYPLDVERMQRAAEVIIGEHDFASFCKSASEPDHHRCTVAESRWVVENDAMVYHVRANRFLHGMVRALVGTMVDIGRGFTPEESFRDILRALNRLHAGMAAPAQGLVLEEVVY